MSILARSITLYIHIYGYQAIMKAMIKPSRMRMLCAFVILIRPKGHFVTLKNEYRRSEDNIGLLDFSTAICLIYDIKWSNFDSFIARKPLETCLTSEPV